MHIEVVGVAKARCSSRRVTWSPCTDHSDANFTRQIFISTASLFWDGVIFWIENNFKADPEAHDIAHQLAVLNHPSICRVSREQETDQRPSRMARVLRIPCQDRDAPFVLVHVNGSPGGSSRPLDLTLVGTEGTFPYLFTCKPHLEVGLLWPPLSRDSCVDQESGPQ